MIFLKYPAVAQYIACSKTLPLFYRIKLNKRVVSSQAAADTTENGGLETSFPEEIEPRRTQIAYLIAPCHMGGKKLETIRPTDNH